MIAVHIYNRQRAIKTYDRHELNDIRVAVARALSELTENVSVYQWEASLHSLNVSQATIVVQAPYSDERHYRREALAKKIAAQCRRVVPQSDDAGVWLQLVHGAFVQID